MSGALLAFVVSVASGAEQGPYRMAMPCRSLAVEGNPERAASRTGEGLSGRRHGACQVPDKTRRSRTDAPQADEARAAPAHPLVEAERRRVLAFCEELEPDEGVQVRRGRAADGERARQNRSTAMPNFWMR
jgi:hypothetical protein